MSVDEKVSLPSEILRRYAAGERDFRGLDIEDATDATSFRRAILDDADFSGACVVADFEGASLRRCRFVGTNVKTCVFDRADLAGADFSNAPIDAATFRSARLDGADFTGASVHSRTLKPGEFPNW